MTNLNHPPLLFSPGQSNAKQLHHIHHSNIQQHRSELGASSSHRIGGESDSKRRNEKSSDKQYSSPNQRQIKKSNNPETHEGSIHHHGSINGLWMLVDGIGLAIITAATILEAMELWKGLLSSAWGDNYFPLILWLSGRISQILGLLFLIGQFLTLKSLPSYELLGHAASFQIFELIEQIGMLLLTIGPILNLSCYLHIQIPNDYNHTFNRQWISSESLELLGILILDISLIHMDEIFVFIAEITGFSLLCCAAGLHFDYRMNNFGGSTTSLGVFSRILQAPHITLRLDMVHSSECFGLILLMVVAYGQYRLKIAKQEIEDSHKLEKHHGRLNKLELV